MTTKQLNAIRHSVYEQAVATMTEQEREALRFFQSRTLWEISEGTKTERTWATYKGVTFAWLEEHGFTKDAQVVRLMTVNQQTKCATDINL